MIPDRCPLCGYLIHAHRNGVCPRDLTVTIDAESIERANRTGHPRILAKVLSNEPTERGAFAGVHIDRLEVRS